MKDKISKVHQNIFKTQPEAVTFAPGRLSLIGEHTGYGSGCTLTMALTLGITCAVSKRSDDQIAFYADAFKDDHIKTFKINDQSFDATMTTEHLIKAMIAKLIKEGFDLKQGLDITLMGDLPMKSGLASSSALMIAVSLAVLDQNNQTIDPLKLAKFTRTVEQTDFRQPTRSLDTYTIMFGKENTALNYHSKASTHDVIPMFPDAYTLLLFNPHKPIDPNDSRIVERRRMVSDGEKHFMNQRPIDSLCELDIPTFNQLRGTMRNPKMIQWVEHVLFEHRRVREATYALEDADMQLFVELINQSHESLKNFFKVTTPEIDYVVDVMMAQGAQAAKMCGIGFGGAVIALFEKADVPKTFEGIIDGYYKRFKLPLGVHIAQAGDGARKLS